MRLILTHVGSDLPNYVKYCLQQLRHTNPNIPVHVLLKEEYIRGNQSLFDEFNVDPIPYDDLESHPITKEFMDVSWYKEWGTPDTKYPGPPNFVQGTSERLYHLAALCEREGWNDVFHIENDVMVYDDLNTILPLVKKNTDYLTLTPVGPDYVACAFVYIPQPKHLAEICEYMLTFLRRGNEWIIKNYPKIDMVQEMTLLNYNKKINYFPILPSDKNYHAYNRKLFDPASWGQYLGGTNNHGNEVGWAGAHHYIGAQILQGRCTAHMDTNNTPIVVYDNKEYKLSTLHVHSKQLQDFLSI